MGCPFVTRVAVVNEPGRNPRDSCTTFPSCGMPHGDRRAEDKWAQVAKGLLGTPSRGGQGGQGSMEDAFFAGGGPQHLPWGINEASRLLPGGFGV